MAKSLKLAGRCGSTVAATVRTDCLSIRLNAAANADEPGDDTGIVFASAKRAVHASNGAI